MKVFDYPNYVVGDTVWPLKIKVTEVIDGIKLPLSTSRMEAIFQLRDGRGALISSQSVGNGLLHSGDGEFIIGSFEAPPIGSYKYQFQITINGFVITILSGSLTTTEDIARYG